MVKSSIGSDEWFDMKDTLTEKLQLINYKFQQGRSSKYIVSRLEHFMPQKYMCEIIPDVSELPNLLTLLKKYFFDRP